MGTRVAVNGLGRIGRAILKGIIDEPAAVNDLADAENLAYLLRLDTVYGRYPRPVAVAQGDLVIAGRKLQTLSKRDPSALPWNDLGVEVVLECTGALTRREGFRAAMTTVHAYTSSQSIVDRPSKRFRQGRAAAANLVPATTGAARATKRALPEYADRFDGIAIRAPIPAGSIADLTFVASRTTGADEVKRILTEEAASTRHTGVLGVSRDPLVSSDIVGDRHASVIDLELTKVIDGDLIKIMTWYDNEWGYANQMLRTALALTGAH
jgi:glyceraldehyde 3-phosphate dehydrogenase